MGIQRNQADKQLDRSEKPTNKEYWQIGKLSLAAYLPAFALIVFSGLYFRPPNKETIELSEGAKKEISTKVKENIDAYKTSSLDEEKLSEKVFNTVKSRLDTDAKVGQAATSPVAHDYIKSIVENEVKKESGNAAKDEVEKLKADWKGDLFGQITFPVIFAIASIFAAFAVKDILTKILEDKDREKLEERLVTDITPRMEKILKKLVQDELDRSINSRLRWIEYEIAIINNDLSVIYGLDSDKKSILADKYKTQELATKYELDIAVIQLISTSPRMTENVRRETIENILIPKPLVSLFSEDYFNADITVKVQRLKLMCNELKESGFLEEELIKDISERIRELGEKSERYADVLEGEERRKTSSTQTDWAKNQP